MRVEAGATNVTLVQEIRVTVLMMRMTRAKAYKERLTKKEQLRTAILLSTSITPRRKTKRR